MEKVKQRLSDAIKYSGLTNTQIAKMIGVAQPTICEYKKMKKLPSLETFMKLCKAIDASADEILGITRY